MKQLILILLAVLALTFDAYAQKKVKQEEKVKEPLEEISIPGLKWREIGPAITSGRISDIAVNPKNPYEYYIATASGGVWKTINNGVTYAPIFDKQGSYSIGCVTIDPNNHNIIWVGTGENNNQRSVAYGDGIYKSTDAGATWQKMGLESSEHIGKIIVHPDNSEVVYVAAIGPLWSKGGDRGVYKTVDGGKTWSAVLALDEHTGVTDLVMNPVNSDEIYAAAYQRRRHVFTYVGGGPGSGMYKTSNAGKDWEKINTGLPKVEIGRIGLDISPADPSIIYAIVEAAENKGGLFRSTNKGASWEKRGNHVTSGNYYQEIITDPKNPDVLYSMDTWMTVSKDGGKTFENVGEDYKHVDNHSMWIDPNNTNHWLVGCDGGIYETFDAAKTWDFKANLPVTQFYKVAVDNDEPFYNVYGGTQDNFSMGGPSRTITDHGITNRDWFITHGGDGFESQIDPENPDIVYAQSQYGVLVRYDRKSGETVGIQPKERKAENAYRWNWDAPLSVSNHKSGRLYFAANKVFRSDDYGNSWTVISEDLTAQIDRNKLKVYDRIVSIDAVAKNGSTSPYGTIVALSESPLDSNIIAIGTDDGLIQITENGGETWRKVDNFPGAPSQSYVNSVLLSNHDKNVIYAALNHHKYGDFKPYIYRSDNLGASWSAISNNLPDRGSVYTIEEDHVDAGLIFCGTEFSAFFSPDAGKTWKKLDNGLPTIAVRDIAIQRRENDMVLGTFGRGFFILDDYSALRSLENKPMETAVIFPTRPALMWEKSMPLGLPGKSFQGDNFYTAENLGPEAMITYFYGIDHKTKADQRKEKEKDLIKAGSNTPYPIYEDLKAETEEIPTQLLFTIKDADGKTIRKIFQKPAKGIQRFHWDLRYAPKDAINLNQPSFYNPFAGKSQGTLVVPGLYTVQMDLYENGKVIALTQPSSFEVKALNNTVLPAEDRSEKVGFQRKVAKLAAEMEACTTMLSEMNNKMKYIIEAVKLAEVPLSDVNQSVLNMQNNLKALGELLYSDRLKRRLDIDQVPTPLQRIGSIEYEQKYATSAPTKTHMDSYKIAFEEFVPIQSKIKDLYTKDMVELEGLLKKSGAPYTPGRVLKF